MLKLGMEKQGLGYPAPAQGQQGLLQLPSPGATWEGPWGKQNPNKTLPSLKAALTCTPVPAPGGPEGSPWESGTGETCGHRDCTAQRNYRFHPH